MFDLLHFINSSYIFGAESVERFVKWQHNVIILSEFVTKINLVLILIFYNKLI